MQDDELRLLIRDAIARHLGTHSGRVAGFGEPALPVAGLVEYDGRAGSWAPKPRRRRSWKTHLSHGRFVFLAPTEPDAPCVVEPEVRCHHCGFCQSYGH